LNLFVTAGVTGRSMSWVMRAALPWLAILLIFLMIVTYLPQLSLFLPELMDQMRGVK
ncbi:MAG: C4-dicarboxylate ABC transporter permease, partial [Rhodospirillaceae bacterium]|nr:C4-dicarboxylate ABC transporter permease [Rhodospirillaceae bacterium]